MLSALILLWALCCFALPAPSNFFDVEQPDGSSFMARNVGDEYFHYKETSDGFPVVRDKMGFFSYANENGESSGNFVREEKFRTASEKEFLSKLDKKAIRAKFREKHKSRKQERSLESGALFLSASNLDNSYSVQYLPKSSKNLAIGTKRVLVLLVQFKDIKFSSKDPNAEYTRYMNEEGYNEYYNLGSVRDYFVENSMGVFTPIFDVVGPITLSGNFYETYGPKGIYGKYNEVAGTQMALREAIDSLLKRDNINFKQYDNDGDGYLDFVYMYYAGIGSHDTGQDSSIWAHSSKIASPIHLARNLYIDRYACSSELDGFAYWHNRNKKILSGIGSFVHEFSHVLGLVDTYGQSLNDSSYYYSIGPYDLMASGSYNCPANIFRSQSCAPPYYNAFERFSVGWFNPRDLYVNGSVKLAPVNNNVAYRIQNPNDENEFYMLEYRSIKKWDSDFPYPGILVWHITFNAKVFASNLINTPTFDYVDLVEADGVQTAMTAAGDPFPGYSRVTEIASFKTTAGEDLGISISEISEAEDYSYVQFTVSMDAEEGSVQYMENDTEVEWEPGSSSSEDIESSEESSSSVSSSSMESSSSEETPIVASSRLLKNEGDAYLFALNGKLLYKGRYAKGFEAPKEFAHMPLVLQVRQNGKVVKTVRLK